jgi:fumarate reductase subunit D
MWPGKDHDAVLEIIQRIIGRIGLEPVKKPVATARTRKHAGFRDLMVTVPYLERVVYGVYVFITQPSPRWEKLMIDVG